MSYRTGRNGRLTRSAWLGGRLRWAPFLGDGETDRQQNRSEENRQEAKGEQSADPALLRLSAASSHARRTTERRQSAVERRAQLRIVLATGSPRSGRVDVAFVIDRPDSRTRTAIEAGSGEKDEYEPEH